MSDDGLLRQRLTQRALLPLVLIERDVTAVDELGIHVPAIRLHPAVACTVGQKTDNAAGQVFRKQYLGSTVGIHAQAQAITQVILALPHRGIEGKSYQAIFVGCHPTAFIAFGVVQPHTGRARSPSGINCILAHLNTHYALVIQHNDAMGTEFINGECSARRHRQCDDCHRQGCNKQSKGDSQQSEAAYGRAKHLQRFYNVHVRGAPLLMSFLGS